MPGLGDQLSQDVSKVKGKWQKRNQKIKEWYDLLLMTDTLKQDNMESYVSNDPKTAYNLALHLLTPQYIPHRIPIDPIKIIEVPETSELERTFGVFWKHADRRNRMRGRQRWIRELMGHVLTTGWYSVLALARPKGTLPNQDQDELLAEIWNPYDVYPEWDDEVGLVQCVHSYTISKLALAKKIKDNGWTNINLTSETYVIDDYWYYDQSSGQVTNAVLNGQTLLKNPQGDPNFRRIPIAVSPCGGLPDRGSILTTDWPVHVGEAMIATNEFVLKNYNRQMTFLQQLLRDTAQPVSYERNQGQTIVSDANDLYKRGAHFKLGINGELGYLQKPQIPVDIRTTLMDVSSQLQRGSLPYVMFGNVMQQITGYMIAQVSASAQQVLTPYADGGQSCMMDVDAMWLEQVQDQKLKPYDLTVPKIPAGVEIEVNMRISIPGDAAQRATVARMLNPQFSLSEAMVIDMMFPEITDPLREIGRVRSEQSMNNPVSLQINLVKAYQEQAQILQASGDTDAGQLFQAAADMLIQQIQQQAGQQGGGGLATQLNQPRQRNPRAEIQPSQAANPQAAGMEPGQSYGGY